MKKIFCLVFLCFIVVSCETNPSQTKEERQVKVESSCIKVYNDAALVARYYEFEYKGHKYVTNYSESFLMHLESCPCHNTSTLFNSNLQTGGSSLFGN